jgi:hypothetical protein
MKTRMFFIAALMLSAGVAYSADFNCAAGDVNCLIVSIQIANGNGQDNTIFLEAATYTLTAVNNNTEGPNGLPSITGRMTIRGPSGSGSTIQRDSTAPEFRFLHVASNGILHLQWLRLTNGRIAPSGLTGGAILNRGTTRILRSQLDHNAATALPSSGGAISNSGELAVTHSTINSNVATINGGGIDSSGELFLEDSFVLSNGANNGGGLRVSGSSTILRSTIAENGSSEAGGGILNFFAGALWIEDSTIDQNASGQPEGGGGVMNFGSLTMISSTVSRNVAPVGGGILNVLGGNMLLRNVTVAENRAAIGAGINGGGLQNTILALNTNLSGAPSNCTSLSSDGNNVFGDLSGCTVTLRSTDIVGDPQLGPFSITASVAGSGHYPLLATSPAINAADSEACTPRDQIHNPRVHACDIGSIEFQPK